MTVTYDIDEINVELQENYPPRHRFSRGRRDAGCHDLSSFTMIHHM
jgi:hypothetical protein